jgi:hypothetical protein
MITRERARELRAVIESAVSAYGLDDAAAVAVVELFPQWEVGKTYAIGTRVQHDGKLYECVNAHTAAAEWSPPVAASLWDEVKVDPETGYDEWQQPSGAHDAYNTGDRVVYNGSVYESLIDGNVWAPDAYPAGWKIVE